MKTIYAQIASLSQTEESPAPEHAGLVNAHEVSRQAEAHDRMSAGFAESVRNESKSFRHVSLRRPFVPVWLSTKKKHLVAILSY